jgi:hypothetical protein
MGLAVMLHQFILGPVAEASHRGGLLGQQPIETLTASS